jgi:hypothetical protein
MLARWSKLSTRFGCAVLAITIGLAVNSVVNAQGNGGNNGLLLSNRVVGGIRLNAEGALTGEMQKLDATLLDALAKGLTKVDADINRPGQRFISLLGLNAAINEAAEAGKPVPADVEFLAGMQRIEYIIVAPNDVILVGYGEGWKADESGNVVGIKSGQPVLKLEDFLVAMRTADNARQDEGISVSIDPTETGVKRIQEYFQTLLTQNVSFHPSMANDVQQVMGNHNISLTGVPTDSRYAQILVAADFKMKLLSMGLEASPISDFPSILEMAQKKDANNIGSIAPRFWMECCYEPIARNDDGTVWQLRGPGVKTLTQESYFDRDGKRTSAGKPNKFAEQWAKNMSERFEELSAAEPVFRELRNIMDMSVVAALIAKEGLLAKANMSIPNIDGQNREITTPVWQSPKTIPTSCSFVHTSRSWIVTASGGVQVDSWAVANNTQTVTGLAVQAGLVKNDTNRWWWNAN